ncbi:MAG: DNA/RNA non-specific endonuclease, partial [Saprospiraceae bacterium]
IWAWLVSIFSFPPEEAQPVAPEPKSEPTIEPQPQPETTAETTAAPESASEPTPDPPKPIEVNPVPDGRTGFNPNFLSVCIPLPPLPEDTDPLLHYRHFSVAMNTARRMPYYTAVNVDAHKYNELKDQIPSRKEMGGDDWDLDPRIPKTAQIPESFYEHNDFDLGHMVRREYALWGNTLTEALAANDDTFYLTNAVPQHKDFNRNAQRWKGLEDYALKNARKNDLRISVFSGPVFNENDRKAKGIQIPGQFWKIIVMVKPDGELSATGYLVQQDDLIESITERDLGFRYEQFKTYQVPLTKIEELTGLQFGLNDHDPIQKTRSIFALPEPIEDYEDIIF